MDIEEGEIIISDVSSDDEQPWNKDKFQVERLRPNHYQNISGSFLHRCGKRSFCRKTFSWRDCIGDTVSAEQPGRPRTYTRNEIADLRTQITERNHSRKRYHQQSNDIHIHENKRAKKKKRKPRSTTSHPTSKHKPERTLRQLINHCENRSLLINEMIQQSRTPPSATVTNENTSLMQKLIVSGLAKPPSRYASSSEAGVKLIEPQSETKVKKEGISVIDIESKEETSDSEIEVIIPPKKVPLLVTLNSDGEEEEERTEDIQSTPSMNQEDEHTRSNVATTTSEEKNSAVEEKRNTSDENQSEDTNPNNCVLSAENLPGIGSDSVIDSSDSDLVSDLMSELCDAIPYSPSSPSTCNSSDNNLAKNPSSLSPTCNKRKVYPNLQYQENLFKDYSAVSSEEISSEIWLDLDEQQPSENHTEINEATFFEESINSKREDQEHCYPEKQNSLSDLVENFINDENSFTSNIISQNQVINKDNLESETEKCCLHKHGKNVETSNEPGNVINEEMLVTTSRSDIRGRNEFEKHFELGNGRQTNDSSNLNENYPLSLSNKSARPGEDEEPYSPDSSYGCGKSSQDDNALSPPLTPSQPSTVPAIKYPSSETCASVSINDNLKESVSLDFKSVPIDPEIKSNSSQGGIETSETASNERSNHISSTECESRDIIKNIQSSDEEEDNVSQLRMIALSTKGKATCKETKLDNCANEGETQLSSKPNDINVDRPNGSQKKANRIDDDDDVLQLRVAALKSAVIKKYGERKKKGLLVKRKLPGFADVISTSPDSKLTSEHENSQPSSPAKSGTSVQGEEDMELADSDSGEDVNQKDNISSSVEESKLDEAVCWNSCSVDLLERTQEISYRNTSISIPPQPLPPGVDEDSTELTSQKSFSSALFPPPPPPPLSSTVFSPLLPPPPPPPLSYCSVESCNKNIKNKSSYSGNTKFLDLPFEESMQNNRLIVNEPISNDEIVEGSNNIDPVRSQTRSNLITIPVMKNTLKPVLTKNQLKKKKRKRNKTVKVLTKPEPSLLCITKPPVKSSIYLGISRNSTVSDKTSTNPVFQRGGENDQEISSYNCEGLTSSRLFNNNQLGESYDANNFIGNEEMLQKQNLNTSGNDQPDSSTGKYGEEYEIDLSDMIVLDEVGMSPEHNSRSEEYLDHSSSQEEDEDVNTLRIRALTTLSPKPVKNKPMKATPDISIPQPYVKPESFHKSWSNYEQRKVKYDTGRGSMSPRVKPMEISTQRKVVGPDTSKYRITRTVSNDQRRSVIHGRESLKVVVPTNSPPLSLPSEPPLPVVNRFVINLEKDSDSEDECEWTRKIRIQDTNASLPPGPVVDLELERSIDELLMRARNSVEIHSSLQSNKDQRSSMRKYESKETSENDFSLHDTPLKLLPKEKQEEYKRLKALIEKKEKERLQMKKATSGKVPEKSKPLLQNVLINENNKQNQKASFENVKEKDDKRIHKETINLRSAQNNDLFKTNSDSLVGSSPCSPLGALKNNFDSGKENRTRIVIINDKNKLNVGSEPRSFESSYELSTVKNLQCQEPKPTFENMIMDKNITSEKPENIFKHDQRRTTQTTSVNENSIKLSIDSSSNSLNKKQDNQLNTENDSQRMETSQCHSKWEISEHPLIQPVDIISEKVIVNTTDKNYTCHLLNEGLEEKTSNNNTLEVEGSSNSLCIESKKQKDNSENSNQVIDIENSEERLKLPSNVNDKTNLIEQEYTPNESYPAVEKLDTTKSELLNERFGLLDDLSEMAESLDDLDSQQGRLEQVAEEISNLRRALRAAEDSLSKQMKVAQSFERRLHDTHTAVTVRYTNITLLETTLQKASYEIPTTAQKLMSKKIKQVQEKIEKVKEKRNIIKCLINNPDMTKDKIMEMHTLHSKKMERTASNDDEVMNSLWLRDPESSQLEDFPINKFDAVRGSKTDSETQTTSSSCTDEIENVMNLCRPCDDGVHEQNSVQASDMTNNSSELAPKTSLSGEEMAGELNYDVSTTRLEMETDNSSCSASNPTSTDVQVPQQSSSSRVVDEESQLTEKEHLNSQIFPKEDFEDLCSLKRSITQVSDDSDYTVAKKPNVMHIQSSCSANEQNMVTDSSINVRPCDSIKKQNPEKKVDVSGKSGTSKKVHSKLQYKSILQFKSPKSRVDSPLGQTILCPYHLTGKCQDKQCKFQHFH